MKTVRGSVIVAHLHDGAVTGSFASSFDGLVQYEMALPEPRMMLPPIRNQSNTDLATGRNQVVKAFLGQTPAEWLLFIDADMGFEPDLIERLLDAADPVKKPVR